jgi:uncharacterized protein (TIGR00661 family)
MRILYGVVGEGMGHAVRSRVIIEHLITSGHEVTIMASSRACDFLAKHFEALNVNRIHGFHLIYEENRVRRGKTLWSNVQAGLAQLPKNIAAYFELIEAFDPEVVVSDFESWTYLFGIIHRLPVLSIDNMQIINRCTLPTSVIEGYEKEFQLTKAFIKSKLPFCSHYLITTFFEPEIRKSRTTLVPPILRPEILQAKATAGAHLLVYQTSESYSELPNTLNELGVECRVYGMRRNIKEDQVEGNLRYRPFSEMGFVEDLASARGVIAGGGFTLMGEAVYLHKPMLCVPTGGQFEQILNARYLQHEGFGMAADKLQSSEPITAFFSRLDEYAGNLARYKQDGNSRVFGEIDAWLDKAQAGLLKFGML